MISRAQLQSRDVRSARISSQRAIFRCPDTLIPWECLLNTQEKDSSHSSYWNKLNVHVSNLKAELK